jgi:hypothetical protein
LLLLHLLAATWSFLLLSTIIFIIVIVILALRLAFFFLDVIVLISVLVTGATLIGSILILRSSFSLSITTQ